MRVSVAPMPVSVLTPVGKAAPPMPTIPASRKTDVSSAGVSPSGLAQGRTVAAGVSRKSFLMRMAGQAPPPGWGRSSMPTTTPDTGAWTGTHSPSPSPIFWPMHTASPTATRGLQGAPMCWRRGTTARAGAARAVRGTEALSSLCPSGWTPPKNRDFIRITSYC